MVLKRGFYCIQVAGLRAAEPGRCLGKDGPAPLLAGSERRMFTTKPTDSWGCSGNSGLKSNVLPVVLPFGIAAGHALGLDAFGKGGDGVEVGEISGCVSLGITGFPRPPHSSGDGVLCNFSCCFGAVWGEVLMSCVCTEKSRKGEILDPFLCTGPKNTQILKHGF